MITKEQIEEMARGYSTRFITEDQFQKQDRIEAYTHGYTQAQKDMKEENEQLNEGFEQWLKLADKKASPYNMTKASYEYQQVKIDKLEKELAQQKFNNAHNLSIDQKVADEIKSLRSDLDKVTMAGIVENWTIGMPNCEQDLREIRLRHNLDKNEEV